MTVLLAIIMTDAHNAESLLLALPAGTTVTTLTLSEAELDKPSARIASEYVLPMTVRTRQAWREGRA